jgi:hypothetical protein
MLISCYPRQKPLQCKNLEGKNANSTFIKNSAASDRVLKQVQLFVLILMLIHFVELVFYILTNNFFSSITNRFYKITLCPKLASPEIKSDCVEVGINAVVAKPINIDHVDDLIQKAQKIP